MIDRNEIREIKRGVNLLNLIGKYTELRKVADTSGGEWHGACPKCGGRDRFCVWPSHPDGFGRFHCIRHCGWRGDALDFVRWAHNLNFVQALEHLSGRSVFTACTAQPRKPAPKQAIRKAAPPSEAWQFAALNFVREAQYELWRNRVALDYLLGRGLSEETIAVAGVGYNPKESSDPGAAWGVSGRVFLPEGWVFPRMFRGELWRVGIRRRSATGSKMIGPKGYSATGLYLADSIDYARPVMLVEGEIDALSVQQAAGDLVTAVATGSTAHARKDKWLTRLGLCPTVLVSFDADSAGDDAAKWWVERLPNSRQWRPPFGDANDLLKDGLLRRWVEVGLETDRIQ